MIYKSVLVFFQIETSWLLRIPYCRVNNTHISLNSIALLYYEITIIGTISHSSMWQVPKWRSVWSMCLSQPSQSSKTVPKRILICKLAILHKNHVFQRTKLFCLHAVYHNIVLKNNNYFYGFLKRWGPFWTLTTVIFLLCVCGNLSSYIAVHIIIN